MTYENAERASIRLMRSIGWVNHFRRLAGRNEILPTDLKPAALSCPVQESPIYSALEGERRVLSPNDPHKFSYDNLGVIDPEDYVRIFYEHWLRDAYPELTIGYTPPMFYGGRFHRKHDAHDVGVATAMRNGWIIYVPTITLGERFFYLQSLFEDLYNPEKT